MTHVLLTPWQVCWFAFLGYTIDSYCHHICDKQIPNRHCRWFHQWILLPYTWGRPLFHPDPAWFPAPGISSFISVEGSIFLVSETISNKITERPGIVILPLCQGEAPFIHAPSTISPYCRWFVWVDIGTATVTVTMRNVWKMAHIEDFMSILFIY